MVSIWSEHQKHGALLTATICIETLEELLSQAQANLNFTMLSCVSCHQAIGVPNSCAVDRERS